MIDGYINSRNKKIKKTYERDNYFFGICFGFILLLINIYFFLSGTDNLLKNIVNVVFMGIGVVLILCATIYPNSLSLIHMFFRKIFNIIGFVLFRIILTIIYFIFVCPVGLIMKKRNKEVINNSNFTDYIHQNISKNSKRGLFNVLQIFRIFANEKYFLMIPLILILIILGILLIFVQSSVITPFIYTLF